MIHQRRDFEAGRYGELYTVEATYHTDGRWFLQRGWSKRPGFSWLFGFLSHAADLVRWYMPDVEEVMGYGRIAGQEAVLSSSTPNTMHLILRSASGGVARCSGSFVSPTLPHARHSQISCILRGERGSGCAEYSNLIYTARFELDEIHDYSHLHDYYFRFEDESHHAGEYQNYFEYFARCLRQGTTPYPDLIEGLGTIALLQAMARSMQWHTSVKISDVIADHGLADIL
jgi:predicted dehydrogenase